MSNFITRAEFEEFKAQLSQQLCCSSQSNSCCNDNGVSNVIYQDGILQVQFENGNVQNYNLPKGIWIEYKNYDLSKVLIEGQFSIDGGASYSSSIQFSLNNIPLIYQPYFNNINLYYKIYEDQHNKVGVINIALYFLNSNNNFLIKALNIDFEVPINIKQSNYSVFTFNTLPNDVLNDENYEFTVIGTGGYVSIGAAQGDLIKKIYGNVYINGQITCELV